MNSIREASVAQDDVNSTENLVARRKKNFIHTALIYHNKPLQPVKAQGEYIWDDQGRRYLDGIGGIVCISAGHNHPRVKEKLMQMLSLIHI